MKYIKLYENFENDFEETWIDEPPSIYNTYNIVKHQVDNVTDFQRGYRYYLYNKYVDKIVLDFDRMEYTFFPVEPIYLNKEDKEKLISGEYIISNGYRIGSNLCKTITYNELLEKGVNVEL